MLSELIMNDPQDHIMANTWRLIFAGTAHSARSMIVHHSATDFSELEEILPEFRLIGFSLADSTPHRQYN